MASVDFKERQLTIKLVYYGPPLSGKTTNLRFLHKQVDRLNRGRLMTLDTKDDRTLFFDLLPIFFKTSGLSFRVKVYTVPGQPIHEATRRIVLQAVDGVAFIADSQASQQRANKESYKNLRKNLESLGISRDRVPIVVQYNKRDLGDIIAEDSMKPFARIPRPEPVYPASAIDGTGVINTFFGLLSHTWDAVDRHMNIAKGFGIGQDAFMEVVKKHINNIAS
ncbi:MAG: gliding motility protein [Proteobacteria bacterium]|nr:gliding motility protein [Pseudomonadota bacterium]